MPQKILRRSRFSREGLRLRALQADEPEKWTSPQPPGERFPLSPRQSLRYSADSMMPLAAAIFQIKSWATVRQTGIRTDGITPRRRYATRDMVALGRRNSNRSQGTVPIFAAERTPQEN